MRLVESCTCGRAGNFENGPGWTAAAEGVLQIPSTAIRGRAQGLLKLRAKLYLGLPSK